MFKDIFRVPLSYWLLIPAILQTTIPWLSFRIRILYVFILMLFWLLINFNSVFSVVCSQASRSFRVVLFWFIVYNFLNNLYALFGMGDFTTYGEATLTLAQLLYFLIAHYLVISNRYKELKFLIFWIFLGLFLAGMMSIRGMGIEGLEGARSLVGVGAKELSAERVEDIILSAMVGLGDYRYVYMCSWVFGIMLIAFVMVKTYCLKIMIVMIAISCVISVKMSGLGTPVFLMGVSVVMFAIWYLFKSRRILKIMGYLLVVLLSLYFTAPIVYRPLVSSLRYIADNMDDGSVKTRVELLADAFLGDDNYAVERARLQLISWETFCEYPILGEGMYHFEYGEIPKNTVGGHSHILDRLAKSGIIGFLPFIIFLYYLGKYYENISRLRFRNDWLTIPTMFISLYVFSSIANPTFGIPNVLYVIMPGLAYLIAESRRDFIVLMPDCNVPIQDFKYLERYN